MINYTYLIGYFSQKILKGKFSRKLNKNNIRDIKKLSLVKPSDIIKIISRLILASF